jgi:hypothetical protein
MVSGYRHFRPAPLPRPLIFYHGIATLEVRRANTLFQLMTILLYAPARGPHL